jgi:branched-chain amino acid transport system ATP-binding protein
MAQDIFTFQDVTRRFGAFTAIDGLSFTVRAGEILGVAGPNGAGKSTMLALCSGQLAPDRGSIRFEGIELAGKRPHTFQIPQIFASMTVRENVTIGALFGPGQRRPEPSSSVDAVLELVGLDAQADQEAASADLMTRKRIMLGAALCTDPKLLLMDEPLGGLNDAEIDTFSALIGEVNRAMGVAVVLVEHKIRALAKLSNRMMILNFGQLVQLDLPEKILTNPQIIELYLGKRYAA